jgi:hypothetical protein
MRVDKQHNHDWPQQVNPLALRSGLCLLTVASKPERGINFRTWEKMLDTMDKAASSSGGQVLIKANLSERCSLPLRVSYPAILPSWTRVVKYANCATPIMRGF